MYLIDAHSYKLKHFFTENLPKYAILSHTWGDDEVTYQDIILDLSAAQQKNGFRKIAYTCRQALEDGLHWAWVDTCCIDKSSSAELSEAINSMYSWYKTSTRCYAHLVDYELHHWTSKVDKNDFRNCRWFTRGWTLQELVAPETIDFYTQSWKLFGSKATLAEAIEEITNIESDFLLHRRSLSEASIAKKMSWAASRQTTRAEDIAYCLLGLFDVNMPLLYGEGHKAFQRLQAQLWQEYDDDSLLAWTVHFPYHDETNSDYLTAFQDTLQEEKAFEKAVNVKGLESLKDELEETRRTVLSMRADARSTMNDTRAFTPTGVFAASPLDFKDSSAVTTSPQSLGEVSVVTKKGLKLGGPVFKIPTPSGSKLFRTPVFSLPLNCAVEGKPVALVTIQNQRHEGTALYTRIGTPKHYHLEKTEDCGVTTAFVSLAASQQLIDKLKQPTFGAKLYVRSPVAMLGHFHKIETTHTKHGWGRDMMFDGSDVLMRFAGDDDGYVSAKPLFSPNVFELKVKLA
ncbi:HET-domain-containing protein [Sarocladium strictum]